MSEISLERSLTFTSQMAASDRLPKSSRPPRLLLSEELDNLPTSDRGVELGVHGTEPAVQEIRNTQLAVEEVPKHVGGTFLTDPARGSLRKRLERL